MNNKKTLTIVASLLIIIGIGIIFIVATKDWNKTDEKVIKEKTYEVAFKVNPLITFKFSVKNEDPIIYDFSLLNDEAKEIFKDVDFINMELNDALDLYGDKLAENKLNFSVINIFTNWDNTEYFKSEKHNINVELVDNEFLKDIENNTSEQLVLNKKYFAVDENNKYDYILFKEDGKMEYSVDGFVYDTDSDVYPHHYEKDNTQLTLKGDEMRGYFGWIFSHDECEILYNRIKCDYYWDTNYDLKEEFIRTEYYEIKK